ncbi:MAG: cyclodeaminase/cyclohydrolase family protein [Candidatus Omnitrophota bacterium]
MYINEPIEKYIADLAAKQPVPGGGSSSGVSGAMGAALLEMTCNFTIGNEKYKEFENNVKRYLAELKDIRACFEKAIDEDVRVYLAIKNAFRSKDARNIDEALREGYVVSIKICKLSIKAMNIANELPDKTNPNLITDVGCGAELIEACFNSAVFNAKINLKGIKDEIFTEREKNLIEGLKKELSGIYKETIIRTEEKMR